LPSYSGQELRLATVLPHFAGAGASLGVYSGVRLSGSGTDLLVQAQSSPNMTVKVNTGVFVAQGSISSTQGAYTWALDTLTNLTISAAHATLSRTDLIVVRIRDANVDTSGQRDGNVVVITGTAGSGTPALPTDASYFTIAQISVPATVTNIGGGGGGTITDKRTFCASLGGVLPFVSTARPSSMMDGQPGWELDTALAYTFRTGSLNKWMRNPHTLTVAADVGFTTTTPGDVTGLSAGVDANSQYLFEINLGVLATSAAGLATQVVAPTGSRNDVGEYGLAYASGAVYNNWQQGGAATVGLGAYGSGPSNFSQARFAGVVSTAGTAGTFKLQAAQGVAGGTSWALRGSTLTIRQVA